MRQKSDYEGLTVKVYDLHFAENARFYKLDIHFALGLYCPHNVLSERFVFGMSTLKTKHTLNILYNKSFERTCEMHNSILQSRLL